MKIIQYLKKRFKKPVKLNCGSVNTRTGQCTTAFQDGFGNIKYKSSGTISLWDEPVYIGMGNMNQTIIQCGISNTVKSISPIYKETNKFTKQSRYYIDDGKYINPDVFENDGHIILL